LIAASGLAQDARTGRRSLLRVVASPAMGANVSDIASSELTAAAAPAAGNVAKARFTGDRRQFRNLMVRGALLQVVTLGIYRFWLTTDARRFLWANTEIDGDSLEYTGTAIELFLGFLIAVALLVPFYVLLFFGTLELGLVSWFSSAAAFVFLAVFGQYAYFRARRYRLTRTVLRGLRFHQSGSALSYALRALAWWIATGITLGLAYPWALASLERYKLAHTHYGEWRGKFAGSGTRLFLRGVGLWLIMIVLFMAYGGVLQVIRSGPLHRATQAAPMDPASVAALLAACLGFSLFVVGAFVYAILQGIIMRWWLAGLRFGPVVIATTLKKRQVFGAYVRCFLYGLLLLILVAIVVGAAVGLLAAGTTISTDNQIMGGILVICLYLFSAVGLWVVYQVTIKLGIWRMAVDSVEIAGFDAIERVRADGTRPSSAVGEGLADALGAGGI
jgi:uncharacterized membrane protein YjgN (DUF898 family)